MKNLKLFIPFLFILISVDAFTQNTATDLVKTASDTLKITPVLHSSLVLSFQNQPIFVDPYGGAHLFKRFKEPAIILITDIHGDHLNKTTLDSLPIEKTTFIVPQEVFNQLPEKIKKKTIMLENGQSVKKLDFLIQAIPMYNITKDRLEKHPKGRGNGYLLTIDDKQIYISGDTEDIEEMRTLKNIDIAFICMNLPYTMDIFQAADAVLEFQPKIIYPNHYRGTGGFSDIQKFKELINSKNTNIEVRLRDWYH